MRRAWHSLLAALLLLGAHPASGGHPVRAKRAMVVAQEPHATDVGVATLQAGGNAVDAAVSTAFALAVTYPSAGNLGGGGFLLIRFADGRSTFIDFRERAPEKASHNMYLDANGQPTRDSVVGWRAAGVPGTVRGLEYAHKKYGRRPWAEVVAPAVRLAENGLTVSWALAESLKGASKLLSQFPESRRIFLKDGAGWEPGDTLIQPELARTLGRIARHGAKDFYEGETARTLAEASAARGGLITLSDLNRYAPVERKPLTGRYRDYEIITAPPPSSGGIGVLQMMGMLEDSGYEKHGSGSAAAIHYVAETMRRFYADRSRYLGDPDFVRIPVAGLLNRRYIGKLRESIDPERASSSEQIGPGNAPDYESTETTHLSIVDAEGNAAALTYTINGSYGNGVTAPGLGFLLNNEMDDFAAKPGEPNMFGLVQGEANAIEPRKRPLSSMTPTIVLLNGRLHMVLGAPGGSRIITGVLQVLLNVIDFKMNIQDSVNAPRFHHQWKPDRLSMERGFSPDTAALLSNRGHRIEPISNVALVEAILYDGGWLQGASDNRAYGKAAGY